MDLSIRQDIKDFLEGWIAGETLLRQSGKIGESLGTFGPEFSKGFTAGLAYISWRIHGDLNLASTVGADLSTIIEQIVDELLDGS